MLLIIKCKQGRKNNSYEKLKIDAESEVNSSINLTDELNLERERKVMYQIKPLDTGHTSCNNYARNDKSFANTFDFFIKLIRKTREEKK